jgi:hypothetical protein
MLRKFIQKSKSILVELLESTADGYVEQARRLGAVRWISKKFNFWNFCFSSFLETKKNYLKITKKNHKIMFTKVFVSSAKTSHRPVPVAVFTESSCLGHATDGSLADVVVHRHILVDFFFAFSENFHHPHTWKIINFHSWETHLLQVNFAFS